MRNLSTRYDDPFVFRNYYGMFFSVPKWVPFIPSQEFPKERHRFQRLRDETKQESREMGVPMSVVVRSWFISLVLYE